MISRRLKLGAVAVATVLGASGYYLYSVLAAQAQGELAQAPLNNQVQVPPAFMMAVDDSGSMTFHNQFPGADGKACWSRDSSNSPYSFFVTSGANAGQLRTGTTSGGACGWAFSYGASPRNGENNSWRGIPPVDTMGFARSSDYNPAYFNPAITYQPWLNSDGTSFGNASLTATRIDPRTGGAGLGTVNLTAWHDGTEVAGSNGDLSDRFNTYNGMVLPAGTVYRTENTNGCGGLTGGTWSRPDGWTYWHTLSSDHTMSAQCNVFIKHRLATFYLKSDTRPPGYGSVPRVKAEDACGPGCDMWRYDIRATDTAALQNFANWFSYYGNRHRALIAGLTRSLTSVNNMRVGFFRISQHASRDEPVSKSSERVAMYDMGDADDKASLYTEILKNFGWSSTYNRQAVNAAGQQLKRTDNQAPVKLQCQKNAIMLFTDGYSNGGGPSVSNSDGDGPMGAPFSDSNANTLGDIAARYYREPLVPGGKVPVPGTCPSSDPKVDCQTALHANFYGVTLGGRGDLFNPDVDKDPYTDPAVYQNWPAREDDDRSTIDDIWHATVNTRGELVNARSPADIVEAMRRILRSVSSGNSPSGTLAVTGSRIGDRTLAIEPSYQINNEGTDWSSELRAVKLERNLATGEVVEAAEGGWEASAVLAGMAAGTRQNHVWFGTSNGTGASQFNGSNVSLAALCSNPRPGMSRCTASEITTELGIDANHAVAYLLGDESEEVGNGGPLRDRTNRLGDIINSTPVVSAPTDDYGYRSLPSPYGSSYGTYLENKRDARNVMVYVGANDGMLHGFDGGMNAEGELDSNGGRERLAFIPRAVLGHMGNLLFPYDAEDGGDQKFDHRYFVDGPLAVSDAYYGGGWKTVLVGTTGAGGRSVFALNVSNPGAFTSSSNKLWEIDDQHPTADVRNNIGHVLGRPVIVPVKSGSTVAWKAIFGNGYNSTNGNAVLFVVDVGTGNVQMISAIEATAPAGSNGLGNVVVADRWGGGSMTTRIRDGYADTVYAADRKGAVWKFDLRSGSSATVTNPVFVTQEHAEDGVRYRQPIIGGLTATAGQGGGVMLFFGTGSFSFGSDAADSSIQSIYGVLDRETGSTVNSGNLLQRSITGTVNGSRTIGGGTMTSGFYGWYLNLPTGERSVGYPRVASGVLFIPTYAPSVADGCATTGFNWLYGLYTRNGGPALSSVRVGSPSGNTRGANVGAIALDTGGTAPVKDVGVTVLSRAAPPEPGDPPNNPDEEHCWMRITVPGAAEPMFVPYPCGRQSWRQIQ